MKNFQYAKAATAEEACGLSGKETRFHGGGIDLMGEMKDYIDSPSRVIDVSDLDQQITDKGDHWLIGGAVKLVAIVRHDALKKSLPGLVQSAEHVGSPQIRNVATVGGNIAQHSRCWYYRQPDVKCLKKGGSQCYACEGINKYHSIFAEGACISPLVSNLGIALSALDARVQVMRKGAVRDMSMEAFYELADVNPRAHNSLQPDDLVVSVKVPKGRKSSSYLQISEKGAFDWALVSCAAAADLQDGILRNVRLYLGVVSPIPYSREKAVAFLAGKKLNEETVAEAARLLMAKADPFEHNGYKVPMARAMAKRALLALEAS
ncbi:MAG: FAD binding domain-containing protein [Pontiella sp.]